MCAVRAVAAIIFALLHASGVLSRLIDLSFHLIAAAKDSALFARVCKRQTVDDAALLGDGGGASGSKSSSISTTKEVAAGLSSMGEGHSEFEMSERQPASSSGNTSREGLYTPPELEPDEEADASDDGRRSSGANTPS